MVWIYGNNSVGTLAASIGPGATQFVLNPGQYTRFPILTGDENTFYVTLTDAATQSVFEIMNVTSNDLAVFTVTRGQDGTMARSWSAGDIVSLRAIRLQYEDFLSKTFGGTVLAPLTVQALLTALSLVVTNNADVGGTVTATGFNSIPPPPPEPPAP